MFSRFWGVQKSPVQEEDGNLTEENQDGFVVVGEQEQSRGSSAYTIEGASAFLPYDMVPPGSSQQQSASFSNASTIGPPSMIEGVPFKLGPAVKLESDGTEAFPITDVINKISSFDFDQYEYSFKLEHDVLSEYNMKHEETARDHEGERSS